MEPYLDICNHSAYYKDYADAWNCKPICHQMKPYCKIQCEPCVDILSIMNSRGNLWVHIAEEAHSEPCQTSKMELFAKLVKGF